jgi:Outer membrane lipoprotein carrier protein LolA-like
VIRGAAFLLTIVATAAVWAAAPADPAAIVGAGEVLRGRFDQQRVLAGLSKPVLSRGSFVLAPGKGLIWRVDEPFEIVTVVTPGGLQQKVQGGATTRISADRLPFLRDLFDLLGGSLAGDWTALQRQFRLTRSGDAGAWTALLEPRSPEGPGMPFASIRLKGGRFMEQVEMIKPNGDRDLLAFSGQAVTAGPPRPDELAAFSEASQ